MRASVREKGVMLPLVVAPLADGTNLLIDGRKRLDCARAAKHKDVPVAFRDLKSKTPKEAYDEAISMCIEANEQRVDLNAWDRAVSYAKLVEMGKSQEEIAKLARRSAPFVSQHLGMLTLDKRVQDILRKNATDGAILSKARILKSIKDVDSQFAVARDCFNKDDPWTTTSLTEAVERIKAKEAAAEERKNAREANKDKPKRAKKDDEEEEEEEEEEKSSIFTEAKMVARIAEVRALGELVEIRLNKLRTAENPDEAKVAYLKGQFDVLKMLIGEKKMPRSIAGDEGED
jgi:ParB/RepB/Spo0J family partition protein